MDERCETCKFSQHLGGYDIRICRRYAPVGAGGWPNVSRNSWCGEWQEKPRSEKEDPAELRGTR